MSGIVQYPNVIMFEAGMRVMRPELGRRDRCALWAGMGRAAKAPYREYARDALRAAYQEAVS